MCRHNPDRISCELCELEVAPIMGQSGKETVFKGGGFGHFSHVDGKGFHSTTDVPGVGVDFPIKIHDDVD